MTLSIPLLLSGVLFVGALIAFHAFFGLMRGFLSTSRRRIARRLISTGLNTTEKEGQKKTIRLDALPESRLTGIWPVSWLASLSWRAGRQTAPERLLLTALGLALVGFVALTIWAPAIPILLRLAISLIAGFGLLVMRLKMQAKARIGKFEEQLSDALDLLVRSLKVGQSLASAVNTVGREAQEPIANEFRIVHEQVAYGKSLPDAFVEMADRVAVPDLHYVSIAIQINHEAGGNLSEVLGGMAELIRSRFRMFRKIKAITAEGRFSAWFLSGFPLCLVFVVQLIKPDYYTQIADWAYFMPGVALVCILLVINVVAMRIITTIKV